MAADVIARYRRLRGETVYLQVGIDEHSINVARKAEELGVVPQVYCDGMAEVYREFFRSLQIDHQRLIRTSDPDHRRVVQDVVLRLAQAGFIYPAQYEGWYCPSCEAFYRERDLVDGHCPVHTFLKPEWITEYNYYFRLSAFEEPIRAYIEAHPGWIAPEVYRNGILRRLADGLEDVSISRNVSEWGIPIPAGLSESVDWSGLGGEDSSDGSAEGQAEWAKRLENHKVYVWFDALLNYVTGAGYGTPALAERWPADLQLIGKDIVWFHGVIQPAVLLALGLPLPKKILVHGFITRDGRKISSSLGNLIYPQEVIERFGVDPLRYYFLRRVSFGQDGHFAWPEFIETYNASLANMFGNLVYRSVKMAEKYFQRLIPVSGPRTECEAALIADRNRTVEEVGGLLDQFQLSLGLRRIEEFVRRTNRYIDETAPWTICDQERLRTVIAHLLDAIYHIAVLLQPFIPGTAEEVAARLAQDGRLHWPAADESLHLAAGAVVSVGKPLFPRCEETVS